MFKTFAASLLLLCGSLSISTANAAQLPVTQIPVTPTTKPQQTTSSPASAPTEPQTQHPLTSADLEAFFDGIIPMQLERSDIAGATVLVMKDGQVLLQKGYGFADEKKRTPVDPATGKLVEGDVDAQTMRAFDNLELVLGDAGLSMDDVIKCNVYLTDMGDFSAINAVYGEHFKEPQPARTTVAVAALPGGAKVEIEMVAEGS